MDTCFNYINKKQIILSVHGWNEYLRKRARIKQLKHRRKIERKRKRAAFRRRKRGLA